MAIVTYLSNAHALSSPCSETLALSPDRRIGPWRFDSAQRLDLLLAAARPGLHQVLLRFEGFARPCLLQHLFCLPKLTIALVATVSGFSQFFLILEHPRRSSIRASVIMFSHFPLLSVVASPLPTSLNPVLPLDPLQLLLPFLHALTITRHTVLHLLRLVVQHDQVAVHEVVAVQLVARLFGVGDVLVDDERGALGRGGGAGADLADGPEFAEEREERGRVDVVGEVFYEEDLVRFQGQFGGAGHFILVV